MRSDTREQRLVTGSKRANKTVSSSLELSSMSNCNALDVAFENYTRVDLGVSSVSNAGTPKASRPKEATKALISDIAAQLDVLDRQRQKLANLLRDVSI